MSARFVVTFILLTIASLQAGSQTLYRCDAGGKMVFQDTPCTTSQRRIFSESEIRQIERQKAEEKAAAVKKAAAEEQAARERLDQEAANQAGNRYAAEQARACGFSGWPKVGQTVAQLLDCYRAPDEKNETITAAGRREQWVYRDWGYVYINEQGLVYAVQHRR